MDLAEAFQNHREKIIDRWIEYTLSTYQSTEFLSKQKDRFANPIGAAVTDSLTRLFDVLAKGADPEEFRDPVAILMRVRAVQDFTPAQAVSPLNAVKHIIREILSADKENAQLIRELYDFEFAVDLAVLAAFDMYVESRERLFKVRIAEIKSGSSILTDSKCPSKLINEDTQDFLKSV